MYSKQYLQEQILASFKDKEISDDLAELIANVLGEYAYLHQIIDINLLMENSFLRSKMLNSKIQHALDNFYSVPRGKNREVLIENFDCVTTPKNSTLYPFDLITKGSTGKYNLYAKDTWTLKSGNTYTNSGYLALDKVERVIHGINKLYLDVGGQNSDGVITPDTNISEQIAVYLAFNEENYNADITLEENNQTVKYTAVTLYDSLNTFWEDQAVDTSKPSPLCIMTTPNYGVRLWSKTPIPETTTYLIKYLTCPDATIPTVSPEKTIKNIPNCKITTDTTITLSLDIENRLEDLDAIYLYASNNIRTNGIMKSINSLETEIPQCFPEFLSYKMIVGPYGGNSSEQASTTDQVLIQDIVSFSSAFEGSSSSSSEEIFYPVLNYVPSGNIYIWYTLDKNPKTNSNGLYIRDFTQLNTTHKQLWDERLKAYYIPDSMHIYFKNTNELLIAGGATSTTPSSHVKVLENYKIKVYYKGNINFSAVESVLDKYQLQIGVDFNPYQIMSDLATDSSLYGIIKYVSIEKLVNGDYVPATIVSISADQRYWFKDNYINLIEYVKV